MQGAEVLHQFLHVACAGARFRRLLQRGRTGARRCDDQGKRRASYQFRAAKTVNDCRSACR
ncbi:hypothetical protein BURMUCGD2_6165 [Burkholderia multivorans CGD2]|uniref:Uncharacterized protein n=1 Tax=Burkholderia multivorans CGD2 TaxID=513052 RepID=B9BWS7_9BURK|nr:hypothetical protein BURMUCGD2_6165 [Burkholderia multivorans CGD2]